jgi:hypothetical protein
MEIYGNKQYRSATLAYDGQGFGLCKSVTCDLAWAFSLYLKSRSAGRF